MCHCLRILAPLRQASMQEAVLPALLPSQEQIQETADIGRDASDGSRRAPSMLHSLLQAAQLRTTRLPIDVSSRRLSTLSPGELRRAHLPLRTYCARATGSVRHTDTLQLSVRTTATKLRPSQDAPRMSRRGGLPSLCLSHRQGLPLPETHRQERPLQPIARLLWATLRRLAELWLPQVRRHMPYRRFGVRPL